MIPTTTPSAAMRHCALLACGLLALATTAPAAELRTANTYRLAAGETAPVATLDAAHWLVGTFTGTAFGARFEQHWSAPSAGSMIGTFKLLDGDSVRFIELLHLSVDGDTLSLKVKHFNADFSAWEDKTEHIDFRLVKFDDDALHFSGLSFYRRDDRSMEAYIVMRDGEELREEHLLYERQ